MISPTFTLVYYIISDWPLIYTHKYIIIYLSFYKVNPLFPLTLLPILAIIYICEQILFGEMAELAEGARLESG